MSTTAPAAIILRLAISVESIVCTLSTKVVDPVPVPQSAASILEHPSRPIPLLTIPGVGGGILAKREAE